MQNSILKKWDEKFSPLATYNSEVSRGILHSVEYSEKMRKLQKEYNELMESMRRRQPNEIH
jgi:hypothetical protein